MAVPNWQHHLEEKVKADLKRGRDGILLLMQVFTCLFKRAAFVEWYMRRTRAGQSKSR